MDNFKLVKELTSPVEVAKVYLGTPKKEKNNKLWYLSPFREERTPSFYVDEKGMYDFGTSIFYDTISFVEHYLNVKSFIAIQVLAKEFNLSLDNEITKKELEIVAQERENRKHEKATKKEWYHNIYSKLAKELNKINEKTQYLGLSFDTMSDNTLELMSELYDRAFKIEFVLEKFEEQSNEYEMLYNMLHIYTTLNLEHGIDEMFNEVATNDFCNKEFQEEDTQDEGINGDNEEEEEL